MKKIIALTLAVLCLVSILAGCNKPAEEKKAEPLTDLNGSLESIIDCIYNNYPEFPEEVKPMLMAMPVDMADEFALPYFTGLTDGSKVKEAVASEPMTGSQPYSVVLVRVNDAADAASVAEQMLNGIDQRKWFCVEADVLRVAAVNDLVMLCMIGSNMDGFSVDTMIETFGKVCDQSFSADLKK